MVRRQCKCKCGRAQPYFGLPGEGPKWCSRCPSKPEGAVNVKNKLCECGQAQPSLGLPGEGPKWCSRCPGKPASALIPRSKRPSLPQAQPRSLASVLPAGAPALGRLAPGGTSGGAGGEAADAFVGRKVMRPFLDPSRPASAAPRWYLGEVTAVHTGVKGYGTVWHVVYEDGDEEDLSREELLGSLLEAVNVKEEDGPLEVKRVKLEQP